MTTNRTTSTTSPTAPAGVVDAIHAVIADHERAFNTKDPELLAAHFRDRSWAVGVTGQELEGPAAIAAAARVLFAGALAEGRARYRPGQVELLGDDVALCHLYATAIDGDGDGEPIGPDPAMVALYVFQRVGDEWLVVARQNTLVGPVPTT
ncbi:SgcJ/EcaC family oxidoreductase [Aquihabitans sp. G128]|uniref:SgcJ/EcaC family oxidoreductase n=1 Tax=Aquihabitans sp. G128 TaxID=2849779 RepID=UPI001C230351|nr:SgcJ/EcaC family oxidoreductase [Aquihabitans sp. G128]QXC61035.1 SgcJ/EcaC family oxidoreductase [Aquihabitans sp. G128]